MKKGIDKEIEKEKTKYCIKILFSMILVFLILFELLVIFYIGNPSTSL